MIAMAFIRGVTSSYKAEIPETFMVICGLWCGHLGTQAKGGPSVPLTLRLSSLLGC